MSLFPVELEVRRQPTTIGAQPVREILSAWLSRDGEFAPASDVNFNFVAFLEPERFHDSCGKADSETGAPFRDLQEALRWIGVSISV
jgi:hypothetical protein